MKKRTKRRDTKRTRARREKRRRDATRHTHETHTQKNTRRRGFPARARERRRRASPTEDVPALCSSPNKTSRLPRADVVPRAASEIHTHHTHTTHRERPRRTQKTTKHKKTKRQRGFPACSQASTNAPQAGLSSLFRWGRLIFCWCERLVGVSARRVCITMVICIGRDTLMGHFCTTRDDADAPMYFHPCVPIGCDPSLTCLGNANGTGARGRRDDATRTKVFHRATHDGGG